MLVKIPMVGRTIRSSAPSRRFGDTLQNANSVSLFSYQTDKGTPIRSCNCKASAPFKIFMKQLEEPFFDNGFAVAACYAYNRYVKTDRWACNLLQSLRYL